MGPVDPKWIEVWELLGESYRSDLRRLADKDGTSLDAAMEKTFREALENFSPFGLNVASVGRS